MVALRSNRTTFDATSTPIEENFGLALQSDGRLVACGYTSAGGTGNENFAIARYAPDGTLDPTFDGDGRVITDINSHDAARGVAVTPDGKITAAGNSGADFSVARYAGSERVYAMQDANFNVTSIADRNGNVIERYQYDPYGSFMVLNANFTADAGNASDIGWQHFHQGGRFDPNAGVYHFNIGGNGRDYSPILGRWLEVDRNPKGHYSNGMNPYEYVTSNPIARTDARGESVSVKRNPWDVNVHHNIPRPPEPSIFEKNPMIQAQVTRPTTRPTRLKFPGDGDSDFELRSIRIPPDRHALDNLVKECPPRRHEGPDPSTETLAAAATLGFLSGMYFGSSIWVFLTK